MITPDILIVSELDDYHSIAVKNELDKIGFNTLIFDNSDFPQKCSIYYELGTSPIINHTLLGTIDLSKVKSVWWRRPKTYLMPKEMKHPTIRKFSISECSQTFKGMLINTAQLFMNDIGNSKKASLKLLQLDKAKKLGLVVPKTIVTTNPQQAISSIKKYGRNFVYKTFTGCDFGIFETRILDINNQSEIVALTSLEFCPMIIQEMIDGEYDIRATVVGEQVFSGKIMFKEGRHPVDGRIDRVPINKCELPQDISDKLVRMTKELGLFYSAIDLRFSKDKGYVFFELNPEGQFLWIEIETGLKISQAIAEFLCKPLFDGSKVKELGTIMN